MQTLEAKSNGFVPEIWANAKEPPLSAPAARVVIGAGYKVEVTIEEVTPDMAERFLAVMVNNRPVKSRHVEFLTREMRAGDWLFNGEPLIFDENGMMIEGQHRCLAAVKSKIPFVTLIVRGVPRRAFDRINVGAKRSAGDILGIGGVSNRDLIAASLTLLLNYRDTGTWWHPGNGSRYSAHTIAGSLPLFPGVQELAPLAAEANRALGGKGSVWLAARYITAQIDAETSRSFFGRLVTGIGLAGNDPEFQLRKRFLEFKGRKFSIAYPEFAAMVVNAWNARRRGRKVTFVRGLQGDAPVPSFV